MAMVRLAVRREQQRQEWRSAMLLQSPVFPAVITVSDCAQTDRNSTTVIANMSSHKYQGEILEILLPPVSCLSSVFRCKNKSLSGKEQM